MRMKIIRSKDKEPYDNKIEVQSGMRWMIIMLQI